MAEQHAKLNIPQHWQQVALKDVCTKITDGTHKTPNYQARGVRFISIKNIRPFQRINWGSYEKYISQAEHEELTKRCDPEYDDVLFPRIGTLGFAKRIDFSETVSLFVGLGLLKPNRQLIRPKYLEYWMNHPLIARLSRDRATGSGRLTLPLAESRELPIPLAPLEEQDKIVAEIEKQFSRLDEAVACLHRVKANLKRYKAAVLKAAVEGHLVETEAELARREGRSYETGEQLLQRILETRRSQWRGKGKYKEAAAPDMTDLPELPEWWVWATLPQLGELNRGKSKHRPRDDKRLYGGTYPFIQTGEVRKSEGAITEFSQTYSDFGLEQSRLWPAGTLCITIAANIADTGILTFAACFPDSVVGFSIENGETTTQYVEYFLRTAREKLKRFAPATAQKNINLEVLKALAVPLPPLSEQGRILSEVDRHFSTARRLQAQIEKSLRRIESTKRSLLSGLFCGTTLWGRESMYNERRRTR